MIVANGFYEFRNQMKDIRSFFVLLPCLCIWIVGAWDLLIGEENSMVGTVEWTSSRSCHSLYIMAIPIFYFHSSLLLIILSSLPVKYQRGVLWTGLSLLFFSSIGNTQPLQETIYFSPRWVGIVCTISLCLSFL